MVEFLWPTPVVIAEVGSPKLNDGLLQAQYLAEEHNRHTNFWDIDHPAVQELQAHFIAQAAELLAARAKANGRTQAPVTTSRGWMNIHRHTDWTSPHSHAAAMCAGVYYVKAEGDCGDLLLHDPAGMTPWCNYVDGPKDCRVYTRIKAQTGRMVLFPGHIVHCTDVNRTHEPRVCIATNFQPFVSNS